MHLTIFIVRTEWDVTRYAEHTKIVKVNPDGDIPESVKMAKYFTQAQFGNIELPATILDLHGHILAWHLPDILSKKRVVSSTEYHFIIYDIYDCDRVIITMQSSVSSNCCKSQRQNTKHASHGEGWVSWMPPKAYSSLEL